MEFVSSVSTSHRELAKTVLMTNSTTPETSKRNVITHLQELPSNITSARVFKLPPGVIFVNPTTGQLVSGAAPPPLVVKLQEKNVSLATKTAGGGNDKNNKSYLPATSVSSMTRPVYKIIERVALPTGTEHIVREQDFPETTSRTASPDNHTGVKSMASPLKKESKPTIKLLSRPVQSSSEETISQIQIRTEPPPLVKINPKPANNSEVDKTETEVSAVKPKPWSREPRPLFRTREPVVLYSGCKPEDLVPKKRRTRDKDSLPQSLPCPKKLDNILPKSFQYHLTSYEELKNPDNFKAELRVNISKKDEALQWLQDFELLSGTNFRITKTFKENSSRIIFKKCFKCFRNTYRKDQIRKKESKRHVGCQARLSITIKNIDMKSSADPLLADFPCVIGMFHNHCHSLTTPDSLRCRRPLPEVREKFADMFRAQVTPATALRVHRADLKRQYGDKYPEVINDGARCPLLPWCYRLYYEICGKKVKDGKKKSLRSLKYAARRKTTIVECQKQSSRGKSNVEVDNNSSDFVTDSFTVSSINEGPAGEVQRSIKSLYDYEFLEKDILENDKNAVTEIKTSDAENSAVLVNDGEMIIYNGGEAEIPQEEAACEEYIEESEILSSDECIGYEGNIECVAYEDNSECVVYEDNGECVVYEENGDCETYEDEGDGVAYEDNVECNVYVEDGSYIPETDDGFTEVSNKVESNEASCSSGYSQQFAIDNVEETKQKLSDTFNYITSKLDIQPYIFLPVVKKFIAEFEQRQETGSDSDLVAALLNFGSEFAKALKPSSSEVLTDEDKDPSAQKKRTYSSSSLNPEAFGNTRRKVLVLRMDPNKFNQILGKVDEKKAKREVVNT